MFKKILKVAAILSLLAATTFGQETAQVQVEAEIQPQSSREVDLVIRAKIVAGLHIYAQTQPKTVSGDKVQRKAKSADRICRRIRSEQGSADVAT